MILKKINEDPTKMIYHIEDTDETKVNNDEKKMEKKEDKKEEPKKEKTKKEEPKKI